MRRLVLGPAGVVALIAGVIGLLVPFRCRSPVPTDRASAGGNGFATDLSAARAEDDKEREEHPDYR